MLDIAMIASVPAIVAIVNLAKDLGLNPKLAPIVAIIAAVCANLLVALKDIPYITETATGLLLGLAASGLYDMTRKDQP